MEKKPQPNRFETEPTPVKPLTATDRVAVTGERSNADKAEDAARQAKNKAQDTAEQAKGKAQDAANQVQAKAQDAANQAQDVAHQAQAKAQDVAHQAQAKAEEVGTEVNQRGDTAMTSTGQQMESLASTVRAKAPEGPVGDAAMRTADALEQGGEYLRKSDPADVRDDLEVMIRKHPVESLMIGFGVGFVVARALRGR